MTVINPSSISGITSITMPSGDGNVLTIHTNDGTERFRIDSSGNVKVGSACTISQDGDVFFTGVTTATTFTGAHSGSGANLTSLPAAQLTGALPAISGANLTGIAATDNVRTGILDVAGVSTFRNTMNVGTAVTISESGLEATGVGITVANINGNAIGGRRNIIINGAMRIAQRAEDSIVTTDGYGSVDRFAVRSANTDEAPSHNRQDGNASAAGENPFLAGLPKSLRVRNGNQTSGAQANSYIFIDYRIEADHMRNSGWNYVDPNSFITLSFYVKSGVAQTYYGYFTTVDGTAMNWPFDIPVAAANTWYRIVKKIPGHANLSFDNDHEMGIRLVIAPYWGTTYTGSVNVNEWSGYDSSARTPDNTSTWYTTNDATFLITGVQLEVGGQVTPFEHTTKTEELNECFRYYRVQSKTRQSGREGGSSGYVMLNSFPLSPHMRNTPTVAMYGSANYNSNVSNIGTVNIASDHVGFTATIADDNYWYYNNGWTADAEL